MSVPERPARALRALMRGRGRSSSFVAIHTDLWPGPAHPHSCAAEHDPCFPNRGLSIPAASVLGRESAVGCHGEIAPIKGIVHSRHRRGVSRALSVAHDAVRRPRLAFEVTVSDERGVAIVRDVDPVPAASLSGISRVCGQVHACPSRYVRLVLAA